jgi:DNA primase
LYKHSESIEYKNAIHYLRSKRKITLSEIVKYNIGYCESGDYAKKIIIPSYDDAGKLNYFVGRAYYEVDFKHKNPDHTKDCVGFELFINWSLPLVLVEGAFDAIAVRRNAIPLFGKTISEDLRKKIIENKVTKLYICLDKDAQKQALEHAEYFMNNGVQVFFVDLFEKDPAEIGFEEMSKLIKQTQPLTFGKFMEYKLFG